MKTFTKIEITSFIASRVDFIIVSNSLISCSQCTNVLPSIRSDHRVVKLVLQFDQFKIESEYWKFNNDFLDDNNYISSIKQVIANYKSNNPADICNSQRHVVLRLDGTPLKCVIRGYTIQYSAQKQ